LKTKSREDGPRGRKAGRAKGISLALRSPEGESQETFAGGDDNEGSCRDGWSSQEKTLIPRDDSGGGEEFGNERPGGPEQSRKPWKKAGGKADLATNTVNRVLAERGGPLGKKKFLGVGKSQLRKTTS